MAEEVELLVTKRVQDLMLNVSDDGGPPKPFICRVDGNASFQMAEIPTVDLSSLGELQGMRSALCAWGCFQAIGHGIRSSFLEELREAARMFFEQSMEEKAKCGKGVREMEGYGGDPLPAEGQPLDWMDRLSSLRSPLRKTLSFTFGLIIPPLSGRQVVEEYTQKMKEFTRVVSKGMARCLGLEDNCLVNQFGERATLQARFNYYPPSPRPDLVLGLKSHSDGSGFTIILQDKVQGLQLRNNDRWYTVPAENPAALLVLLGDQMEIMSNGVFKSPVHRVLSNAAKPRISIAVFYTPELGKEIGPEKALTNGHSPVLYKQVTDYAVAHADLYLKGKRAIQTAKI